jgi:hypothetical protein
MDPKEGYDAIGYAAHDPQGDLKPFKFKRRYNLTIYAHHITLVICFLLIPVLGQHISCEIRCCSIQFLLGHGRFPGPEDVVLDVKYCGICYAEIVWTKNFLGDVQYPVVPG